MRTLKQIAAQVKVTCTDSGMHVLAYPRSTLYSKKVSQLKGVEVPIITAECADIRHLLCIRASWPGGRARVQARADRSACLSVVGVRQYEDEEWRLVPIDNGTLLILVRRSSRQHQLLETKNMGRLTFNLPRAMLGTVKVLVVPARTA